MFVCVWRGGESRQSKSWSFHKAIYILVKLHVIWFSKPSSCNGELLLHMLSNAYITDCFFFLNSH